MPLRDANKAQLLNEVEIKSIVLSQKEIRQVKPPVANEYAVGRNARRADLVVMRDEWTGFEIKSDYDSLYRLDAQIAEYLKYFDRLVVVTTSRHASKILSMPRVDFDVWQASTSGKIEVLRRHDRKLHLAPTDLIRLLTKQEAERFLGTSDRTKLGMVSLCEAKSAVRAAFLDRHSVSSDAFWESVGKGKVRPEQLEALSLFLPLRRRAMSKTKTAKDFWENWDQSAERFFALRTRQISADKNVASS